MSRIDANGRALIAGPPSHRRARSAHRSSSRRTSPSGVAREVASTSSPSFVDGAIATTADLRLEDDRRPLAEREVPRRARAPRRSRRSAPRRPPAPRRGRPQATYAPASTSPSRSSSSAVCSASLEHVGEQEPRVVRRCRRGARLGSRGSSAPPRAARRARCASALATCSSPSPCAAARREVLAPPAAMPPLLEADEAHPLERAEVPGHEPQHHVPLVERALEIAAVDARCARADRAPSAKCGCRSSPRSATLSARSSCPCRRSASPSGTKTRLAGSRASSSLRRRTSSAIGVRLQEVHAGASASRARHARAPASRARRARAAGSAPSSRARSRSPPRARPRSRDRDARSGVSGSLCTARRSSSTASA